MRNIARNLIWILPVVILSAGFLFFYISENRPNAIVNSNKLDYSERLMALEAKYSQTLDAIPPPCAPDYERDCILTAALDQIEASPAKRKETFPSLIKVADAISYSGDQTLKRRALNNLNTFKGYDFDQEVARQVSIMKLHFGLDEFEKGFGVLESFQGDYSKMDYWRAPHIEAIDYFLEKNDLQSANKIALSASRHKAVLPHTIDGCFGAQGSKVEKIANLIKQNIEAGDVIAASALLSVAIDKGSIYFDDRAYYKVKDIIDHWYVNNPDSMPLSDSACQQMMDESPRIFERQSLHQHSVVARQLGRWGCPRQLDAYLTKFNESNIDLDKNQEGEGVYFFALAMAGRGDEALERIGAIPRTKDRSDAYITLASFMHDLGQEEMASVGFKEAIASFKNNVDYIRSPKDAGSFLHHLKRSGRNSEAIAVLDMLIANKGSKELVLQDQNLVNSLKSFEHPYYARIIDDVLELRANDHNELFNLIERRLSEGDPQGAADAFDQISPRAQAAASDRVLPLLYQTDHKSPLFEKVWRNVMKQCAYQEMEIQKNEDLSIIVPECMSRAAVRSLGNDLTYYYP